jgi:hypothetical protein
MSYRSKRRVFLQSLGGAALAFGPLLDMLEASAQGAAPPKRLLIIHHPLGAVREYWRPAGGERDFSFSQILQPFAPLRDKLVILDGMDIRWAVSGGATHEGGMVALMTGQPTLGKILTNEQDHAAGGASIDQLLLDHPSSTLKTPLGSLQLAAATKSDFDAVSPRVMSYRPPLPNEPDIAKANQPLHPEKQPQVAYTRMFSNMMPGGDTPQNQLSLERARARKRSVLDFAKADLTRLGTLAPASERWKLDAHAEAIRKLEVSFDSSPVGCDVIEQPRLFPEFTHQYGDDPFHAEVGQLHLAVIRTAFACDLLRVATFMWSPGTNHVVFGDLYPGMQPREHHPPSHTTDEAELMTLAHIDAWYSARTSEALQAFDEIVDLDGNSLLDSTIVPYVTEIGRAYDHDFTNSPVCIFGGGERIPGGRFLDFSTAHRPINDVWLSLAPIFGVNLSSLGAADQYSGPLPGLVV